MPYMYSSKTQSLCCPTIGWIYTVCIKKLRNWKITNFRSRNASALFSALICLGRRCHDNRQCQRLFLRRKNCNKKPHVGNAYLQKKGFLFKNVNFHYNNKEFCVSIDMWFIRRFFSNIPKIWILEVEICNLRNGVISVIFKRRQVASIRPNVCWSVCLSVCRNFFQTQNNQKIKRIKIDCLIFLIFLWRVTPSRS